MTSSTAENVACLTISIATRNRPEVVEATLLHLLRFGLGDAEVLVCDDGSDPPLVCPTLARFSRGRLLRNDTSIGQALTRNRIARESSGTFLLQLDDDSYPVSGDINRLLALAHSTTHWLAFAIAFDEPRRNRVFNEAPAHGTALRGFVGCSVLLAREPFLRIGGYATWIERTVEEDELCVRGHGAGLKVFFSDILRIRHDVSPVTRDPRGIAYRSFRNWALTWLQHAPLAWLPVRLARLLGAATISAVRDGSAAPLLGIARAITESPVALARRTPLSYRNYQVFMNLPHALGFLHRCVESSAVASETEA